MSTLLDSDRERIKLIDYNGNMKNWIYKDKDVNAYSHELKFRASSSIKLIIHTYISSS